MYQLQESDVYKHYLVSLIQQDKVSVIPNHYLGVKTINMITT